jgi:hypothetical protein
MYRSCIFGLLAGIIGVAGIAQAFAQQVCRPALAFTEIQLSPMQAPTRERRWTAKVLADASRCATTAGYFNMPGVSHDQRRIQWAWIQCATIAAWEEFLAN